MLSKAFRKFSSNFFSEAYPMTTPRLILIFCLKHYNFDFSELFYMKYVNVCGSPRYGDFNCFFIITAGYILRFLPSSESVF